MATLQTATNPIKARSAWTTSPASGAARTDTKAVTHLLIHHPGMGKTNGAALTEAQVIAKLNAWRNQHIGQGWGDIGYNYAIDQRGNIWELRGTRIGTQAKNFNSKSIGVLLIIGDDEKPTPEAAASVHALRARLKVTFPNLSNMMGHGEAPGQSTSCPGKLTMDTIGWVHYVPAAEAPINQAGVLKRGSKGKRVEALQYGLNGRKTTNPKLIQDGDFGPKTEAAVMAFQKSRGLVVDGWVGSKTTAELNRVGIEF